MNDTTKEFLKIVSDIESGDLEKTAFNIREDSQCAGRQSTPNINISSKENGSGIDIRISKNAQKETVYIPACVTHGNVDDVVYNDFYVEDGADVIIVAGCGVHTADGHDARHNGIHRFFVGKGAKVLYKEKHIGTGNGVGKKIIDPITEVYLADDAILEMDTIQLGGVDRTVRKTTGKLEKGARLLIHERIMTDGDETAKTEFEVELDGENSGVDLVSRSVAKGNSYQEYYSTIKGNCRCTGHSECDAILVGNGRVNAAPTLFAGDIDASLIHEAAIGKIAGEQLIKLQTLGLTSEEAEAKIIEGFLRG